MATCPSCRVSTRVEPGAMVIETVFEGKPLGTFSVSGSAIKFSVIERLQLRCTRCDFKVFGHMEDGKFVAKASDVSSAMRDGERKKGPRP